MRSTDLVLALVTEIAIRAARRTEQRPLAKRGWGTGLIYEGRTVGGIDEISALAEAFGADLPFFVRALRMVSTER
jgi:hypothetical protein